MRSAESAAADAARIAALLAQYPLEVVRAALHTPAAAVALGGMPDGWAYRLVVRLHTFHLTPPWAARPLAQVLLLPPLGDWEAHLVAAVLPDYCDHLGLVQPGRWRIR